MLWPSSVCKERFGQKARSLPLCPGKGSMTEVIKRYFGFSCMSSLGSVSIRGFSSCIHTLWLTNWHASLQRSKQLLLVQTWAWWWGDGAGPLWGLHSHAVAAVGGENPFHTMWQWQERSQHAPSCVLVIRSIRPQCGTAMCWTPVGQWQPRPCHEVAMGISISETTSFWKYFLS